MASRSHTTFKKRQRELARLEKRQEKAAKRQQRKLEKQPHEAGADGEPAEVAGVVESAPDVLDGGRPA